jgi:hypothetical protein
VPTLPLSASLRAGQSRIVHGLPDSTEATLSQGAPATFRSNLGMVETAGKSATVQLTLITADGHTLGSKEITLAAHQYSSLNRISQAVLGEARLLYGDLSDLSLKVEVAGGDGAVAFYVSSVDNGTGDSITRSE